MKFRRSMLGTLAVAFTALVCSATSAGAKFVNPKAFVPPVAHPSRISGGESVPPLPLPATPLRRTERKRQPAPPALVGKINLSMIKGNSVKSYPTETLDIETLMHYANSQLGLHYRYVNVNLNRFSFDPAQLPVLYLTGWTPLPKFSPKLIARLRQYIVAGGTLVVHASCGRPSFNRSFQQLQAEMFPNRPMAPLPLDSPLYDCLNRITSMRVRDGMGPWKKIPVYLQAMYMGCRAAIIFSPVDMSWGWDAGKHPIKGGILYDQFDSLKLGANILTYALANYQYARAFQFQKIYQQNKAPTRDQLVLAQLQNNGDWNPTPHGLPNLLKFINQQSTLRVQFKRVTVSLANLNVLKYPVVYMTGLRDFSFTAPEIQRLHDYLHAGGILIVDCAMGSSSFDAGFQKMMAQAMPHHKLRVLPPNSPIYHNVFNISHVSYSPLVQTAQPGLHTPLLQAIMRNGAPCVIYSRISMSNGWEELPNPYARAYSDKDALKLGTNIMVYCLTH